MLGVGTFEVPSLCAWYGFILIMSWKRSGFFGEDGGNNASLLDGVIKFIHSFIHSSCNQY